MKVHRHDIARWIAELVASRWPGFEYRGRLQGYRYAFTREGRSKPFPVFEHLMIQHHRRSLQVRAQLASSALARWHLGQPLQSIALYSPTWRCDVSSQERFPAARELFEMEVTDALGSFFESASARLADDRELEKGMWLVHSGKDLATSGLPPELLEELALTVGQEKVVMEKPTDEMAEFLAELVPQAAPVSRGSFTLEASKAREKLREFQLARPQTFVVHLVGAAIAGGASEVKVYVDSDDIVVDFDGLPMDKHELEHVFTSLLSDDFSRRAQEMSVALNAALSLQPKRLTVDSWKDGQGWRLDVTDQQVLTPLEGGEFGDGHSVHFRDKPGLKVLQRFLNSLAREHPEVDLLRERCRHAPVPVLVSSGEDCREFPLEDAVASLRWENPDQPLASLEFEGVPGIRGESPGEFSLLLLLGPSPSTTACIYGVDYTVPAPEEALDLWCTLYDSGLNRDLSWTSVRLDEYWEKRSAQLSEAARSLVRFAIDNYPPEEQGQRVKWSRALLRLGPNGLGEEWERLPLFRTIRGDWYSASALRQMETLLHTDREWTYPLRSGEPVFVFSQGELELLELPKSQEALGLASSQVYFERLAQWREKPPHQVLALKSKGPLRALPDLTGWVGLAEDARSDTVLELYAQMRPLPPRVEPENLPKGLWIAVNHDDLETDDPWENVLDGEALQEVRKVIGNELNGFFLELLDEGPEFTEHILSYLVFLKAKRRAWEGMAGGLRFRLLDGSVRTLAELQEAEGFRGLSAQWARRFHLSRLERTLLGELFD